MSGRTHAGLLICLTSLVVVAPSLAAQDVEPRNLSPAPVGTNVVGLTLGHATGGILLDKAVPVEDLDGNVTSLAPSYTRFIGLFGTTSRISAAIPFATGGWDAFVGADSVETDVTRTGVGDAVVTLTTFLAGARAMTPNEFQDYRRKTLVGLNLRVRAPTGQYDPDNLINIGSNRWAFVLASGVSQWIGKWTLEGYAGVWLFTDNKAFLGDQVFSQAPLYAFQLNVEYSFKPNLWASVGLRQTVGGRPSVDGVEGSLEFDNTRLGALLALPIARRHTLRFSATSGINTALGNDFESFVAQWFYTW